jgi:hypothetical protein
MAAAQRVEPEGAGAAAGLNIGRLGAGVIGNGDLPDAHAGSLTVEQGGDFAPEPFAGAVELVIGHSVDRGPGADLGDPPLSARRGPIVRADPLIDKCSALRWVERPQRSSRRSPPAQVSPWFASSQAVSTPP